MTVIEKLIAAGQEAARRSATMGVKLEGDAFLIVRKVTMNGQPGFATAKVPIAALEEDGNRLLDEIASDFPTELSSPPAPAARASARRRARAHHPAAASPAARAAPDRADARPAAGVAPAAEAIERAQVLFRRAAAAGLNDAERERLQAEGLKVQAEAIAALRSHLVA